MQWRTVCAGLALGLVACGSDGGNATDAASSEGADAAAVDADVDAGPPPHGFRATYFRHHGEATTVERVEDVLDVTWGEDGPAPEIGADRFSARWTATLDVPAAGDYTFVVRSDDGARLWVGDGASPIVDDWRFHFVERHEATVRLPAGPVALRVEYFEKDLAAEMHLGWSSAAFAEEIIPTERLTAGAASALAPEPPYDNPVVPFDCPDPGVLADGGTFYMVCTGGRFAIRRSDDLVIWEDTGASVLPADKAPWAANGFRNWAPELHRVGDRYVAYFTAADAADHLAIGVAWATSPLGPYTFSDAPLVQDPVGVIDATYLRDDDGRGYLVYKIDGNSQGQPTPIFARELAADGLAFAPGSVRHQLLVNQPGTWEGGVVEAPWLVKHDGTYYLFYSGNVYDARYRTGVARASSLLGPYEKLGTPILSNNARWVGPGHGSVVHTDGEDFFVYHAWPALPGGGHDAAQGRHTLLDRIVWEDGWPRLSDGTPSTSLQRWP